MLQINPNPTFFPSLYSVTTLSLLSYQLLFAIVFFLSTFFSPFMLSTPSPLFPLRLHLAMSHNPYCNFNTEEGKKLHK